MNEALEKAGRLLFYNPWCTGEVIRAMGGMSRAGLEFLEDGALFERLLIPAADGRGYQAVYGLTAIGQRTFMNCCRSPQGLAEALLLQHGRLARARKGVARLAKTGRLLWSISPWKPYRSSPYFDALLALQAAPGRACLAVLAAPRPGARLEWYLDLLSAWRRWRRDSSAMPAVLLLWQPPLEPEGLEVLREIAPRGAGSRVLLAGKHDLEHPAKWQPLLKLKPGGENLNARTVPEGVLLPAAFLAGTRKSPYPGAANLIQWAQKNSGQDEFSTAFYIGSQAGELSLLEDLARFPGLTRPELNRLNPQAKSGRRLEGRLLSLRQAGLVAETHEGQILVAERGLNLLAGLRGVSRQSANRYLGWPVRKKGFQGVLSHQGAVLEFMLRLRDEGALYAWDFNSARFLFWRSGANPGGRPLVIVPDTAAALIFGPDRLARFWLELDRGTSRGKRLAWKLEKYFLASIARLASAKIPPLLIVIDRDGWREENRLQKIARLLKVLGCKYPASPLLALLTTGDLLRGASAPLLEVRLWRVFTGGRLETGLVSLREGLGCGRA